MKSEEKNRSQPGRPTETKSLKGRHFFLTIPHFDSDINEVIKAIQKNEPQGEFLKYVVVKESHTQDPNKGAHLHLYIAYPRQCYIKLDRFDYLGKHGKLERVRNYSAVLKYMTKQNIPTANFDYIEDIMKKDFPRAVEILMSQGLTIREIYRQYSSIVASKNWSGHLRFLAHRQESERFLAELRKPGIRMITPELIKARLDPEQYKLFYSHDRYQRIVDLVNDIVVYGGNRPFKAKALLLVGEPNLGKTTFVRALQQRVGTFTFPDDGWWAGYESDVFKAIFWDQLNLRRMDYTTLLKFLQGSRMNLPVKGSHVLRTDNPLIICTSNLSLENHICGRFSSEQNRGHSRANLRARIEEVDLDSNPIFFLEKLLVSPTEDI